MTYRQLFLTQSWRLYVCCWSLRHEKWSWVRWHLLKLLLLSIQSHYCHHISNQWYVYIQLVTVLFLGSKIIHGDCNVFIIIVFFLKEIKLSARWTWAAIGYYLVFKISFGFAEITKCNLCFLQMSSLTSMKEDCHHHFRFKAKEVYTKLVKKFG